MKSFKKFFAVLLAVMHVLTFSAPAQQINIQEGTTVNVDSIQVNSGEQLTINVLDQLGQVCPSCRGILETNHFLNNGAIDIWGILAIIAPTIINNGTITVQGDLLLSNLGINQEQFFAGIAELSKDPSLANGYILNTGEIKNLTQGLLALVAANGGVHNLGTISSNGGAVVLAAGDRASFPLTRDGVLNIDLGSVTGVKGQVFDKDGNLVETNGLVTNAGVLQANGGAVVLQAAGAEAIYDSIINHTGIIEAKSVAQENGKIILKSETGNITVNNATIDASGYNAGEKGGSIELLTQGNVIVEGNSVLDASGDIGGGSILIGSDVGVTGPITASNVFVGSGVEVKADAVTNGNGGKIIVGAEEVALAYGSFSAKGGAQGGNGGFIETSGKEYLDVAGIGIDASAVQGKAGTWLLDPSHITLSNSPTVTTPSGGLTATNSFTSAANSTINVADINSKLNAGTSVSITTGDANSDITLASGADISKTSGSETVSLTLTATRDILLNGTIGAAVTLTGILNVILSAGRHIDFKNTLSTNGGSISATSTGGNILLSAAAADLVTSGGFFNASASGDFNMSNSGSSITTSGGQVDVVADGVTTRAINSGSGAINLTASDGNLTVSNALTTNNADITLQATGTIDLDNSASDVVTNGGKYTATANTDNTGSGDYKQSNSGSSVTTAGGNVSIAGKGADINGAISSGAGTIDVTGSDGSVKIGNALTTNNAAISLTATSNVTLDTSLADIQTNGGNFIVVADSDNSGAGTFTKTNTGSSVLTNGGNMDIEGAVVDINGVFNSGAGNIDITAKTTSVKISNSLTTTGGDITLTAKTDVNLDNALSDITTAGGAFTAVADSDANNSGNFNMSNAGSSINTSAGQLSITAADVALLGTLASSSVVKLITSAAGRTIGLGGGTGDFNVTDAEVDLITSGSIEIGASNSGNIKVNDFSPNNSSKLILRTGGSLTEGTADSAADITVASLGVQSATGVNVDVDVTNLGVSNSSSGNVDVTDTTGGVIVNAITNSGTTINGVTNANGGNIALQTVGGALGVNDNISTTGDVTLTSSSSINQTAGAINSDDLNFTAGGAVMLNQTANDFATINGSTTSGVINIADSATNTTIQNLQTVGNTIDYSHTGAGDVTVTGTISSGNGSTDGGNITINSSNALTTNVGSLISSTIGSGGVVSIGSAVVNGTITAGAGNITLGGGAVVLDTIINTTITGAAAILITALRDVIISSSVTGPAATNMTITADTDVDGDGGVWLKTGADINSDANLTITGSKINDVGANGESVRIDAGATVDAVGDIILQKSTAAPATADILVNGIVNTTGLNKTITVNSNDQINSSDDGTAEFVGANLSLTAKNGINVESNVTNASYNNSTSGNVAIEDMSGGLTITGATNGGNGSTTILTHSPLTIAANLIQAGTINLTAGEAAGAGDDLTVNSGITVQSTAGDVNLNAGDNVVLNATSVVQSDTGAVTVTAGSGDTDTAGNISLGGLISAATTATLSALQGAISDTNGAANNLTAASLTATSKSGIDLDTTITTLTNANVSGTGAIDIYDLAGGLAVTSATTNDGAITINATGGNLDVTTATAGGGEDINLGTITSGNVNVGNVTAAGDNIVINSAGAIEELGSDVGADLTANDLELTAVNGVGAADTIETDATTLLNANVSSTGAINLSDIAGGLAVTSATTNDGAITINATGGNLDATTVTAGGTARNVTLSTTTSGDVNIGTVTATDDTVTVNSAGEIQELVNDDAGAPTADIIAGTIQLNSNGDVGASNSYFDIQPSVKWGANTNGNNLFINCIGDCPIDQIDLGTSTFNFSTTGALTDGNDDVNGEFNGGTWNITAGGINIKTGTGFGTVTDAIELRLAGFGGVLTDAGRMAVDGGTGGVYAVNKNLLNGAGLAIGGVAGSFVAGIQAMAGIAIGSGSPLAVNAAVNETGGGDIYLAALGNAATDDLTVNANISATGGNGDVALVAGDSVILGAGTTTSVVGSGTIDVLAGEDATDLIVDQDGNANGSISMDGTASLVSAGGTITLDAAKDIVAGIVNASAGIVSFFARTGAVNDANGVSNNITATSMTATAATGIDLDTTITTLTNANVTGTGAVDINDLAGGLAVTSATTNDGAITINATGGNLDVTVATAGGGEDINLGTITSGDVKVGNVTAAGDNIVINSAGAIEELGGDAGADLTANDLDLTSVTGIGDAARVEVDATTLINANVTGTGKINLRDVNGGLDVTSATTNNGRIQLSAVSGDLNVTSAVAGGNNKNVDLETISSGNVNVDDVRANGDVINVTSAGAIEELGSDNGADLRSDSMNLTSATGVGAAAQLEINAVTLTNASVSGTGAINISDVNGGLAVTSATTNDGAITINATGGNLAATTVTAGGAGRDINLTTTTSGDITLGTITALDDTATVTSAGTIGELTNDDAGAQSSDVNAGTINLTTGGGDIGAFTSYLDITPTTLWNATSNGGDIYVSCIGVCPMGQIDAGTGTFYYAGNITDGNDSVNGEVAGGVWNIRAGGLHADADNSVSGFIGSTSNWIETQLANYDAVVGALGRFVATASTGGIHLSNDGGAGHPGLQVGGVAPSTITGLTSTGGIEIYSFSPLVIAANVIDNSANSIDLVAVGNVGSDDLTVNTGVTVDQLGSGAINLFAGDDIQLQGTALVQSNGGVITAAAGEDRTGDLITDAFEADGTNGASIVMSSNSAFRSQGGNIGLTANNHLRISEVNATTAGDVTLTADANGNGVGRIEDRNGANQLNVTGDDVTMTAGSGIGVDGANVIDAIETSINRLTLSNTTSGHVAVTEVSAGGQLDIVNATQSAVDTMTIQTTNGDLRVLGAGNGGSGVSAQSGELTLAANGGGANDDLIVNNTVTSTTGKINLDSTSRDVRFNANGDVTATGGAEIEVNAFRDVTMANGTVLNANAGGVQGGIDIDAGRDVTLGSVQTTSALSVDVNNDAFNAVQIDAGGAVIDGGDTDNDIIANSGQTTINAVNGIGHGGQLDVQLQSLRATNTTANDIRVREMAAGGDLNIVGIDQLATTGDLNIRTQNGSLTVMAAATLLSGFAGGVAAVDGVTRLFAQDNDASGADHLNINNTVKSADGKINLDSENDVIASAEGDVTSGDVTRKVGATGAEIEVDALGNITMADGTIFNANAGGPQGSIDMDAQNGDITLGSVQTTSNSNNAVVIVAQNGQIIDGGDTDTDIVTGATGASHLVAKTGIGSANGLETQMGQLAARTETGNIQIFNQGDMTVTSLTDNHSSGQTGNNGGTTSGVQITDPTNLNTGNNFIFLTNNGNLTVNNDISNLDGGDVSVYSFGNVGLGDMNINANIESIGANGNMRVVSGGDMNMAAGTNISTEGNSVASGTGVVAVGAGYDVSGKTRNPDMSVNPVFAADVLPGLSATSLATTSTNGAGSLLDTVKDATANLTMDETARISSEDGQIIVDAQNNFTVGRVDADGNASANGITDGVRGNILAFARNGSILDAEGPGEVGNLDFLANSLTMLAAGTIGLSNNRIEGTAPFLNTFSIGSQFISMLGDTQVEMNSAGGSIFLNATGTILLGHMSAPSGEVHAVAGNNILSQGGGETRVTASNLIELIANGIVGTTSNPIHTHLNATPAQLNLSAGGQAGNGVSAAVFSNISPLAINMLNNPPGLVLFNGTPVAGQPLPGLIGSQASLYYKAFVRGLRQYGDFDGNYAADFPGFVDYQDLITSPDLSVDTTGLDIPLRGITTAPRVVPIPAPAVPTPVQPSATEAQPVVQPQAPELSAQEPTPPVVVPIPARAQPSDQATTDEGVPETPAASN